MLTDIQGTNVMLGPMNNIARVPVDGRNYESTGEDPYLAAQYVTQCVKGAHKNHLNVIYAGVQSQGVIACSKHYADNNQEKNRGTISAHVTERTQYGI